MTSQLLAVELANLIQESKRKHNDLKQAAEKSLEDLRSIKSASEAQTAAELSHKTNFVNPFIIACGTKNAKFTGIAIVCLQRLIVAKAVPRPRLNQVLEALSEATSSGLDVQLKILQALPSLLQNYSTDMKGELLITTLNICFILQSSKNVIVNNTSAATLQQLVVSVFDKVVSEDKAGDITPAGEAPTSDGTVQLGAAGLDAYRVFNDICLMTGGQRPEFLRLAGMPQTFGLELIESVLTNHAVIFTTHAEEAHILRTRVMPFITTALSGKPNFATVVRLARILYTLLRRHLALLPSESGDALDILTQLLDQDTAVWKRALCMEVFRGLFAEPGLLRRIFMMYDGQEGEKPVLKNLTATFVRVSTERPSVIGLGYQSTIPVVNPYSSIGSSADQAMLEASGVSGIITSSMANDGHNTGISSQWSSMRVPCIDQLDKTEPPALPDTYLYSLTLACITSLSEGLAKFILPLTVPSDNRRKKGSRQESAADPLLSAGQTDERSVSISSKMSLERSVSFKKNPVPVNPLSIDDHPLIAEIRACAALIEECWPAILATCSTFLYAALDSDYYHGLVRAFQKFAHVAGLLQLSTPRDAFLTTLGKAAVPPNIFTACMNAGSRSVVTPSQEPQTPNTILSNARGLLSVDSFVSQASGSDRPRQSSFDVTASTLNTRNLLCLRALLNLGIALGPNLSSSWQIVLETLQQADFVLFTSGKTAGRTPTATKTPDQQADSEANSLLANFGTEIKAVETAASRLFESTVDFPNESFMEVVQALCGLLDSKREPEPAVDPGSQSSPPPSATLKTPMGQHRRAVSVSTSLAAGANQEDQFALAKLGDIASINLERLLTSNPDESGWIPLVHELISMLTSTTANPPVRIRAAEILVRFVLEAFNAVAAQPEDFRGDVQLRLLEALKGAITPIQKPDRSISISAHSTDIDIHRVILDGLKVILENCGETLVEGWSLAFYIVDSIFIDRRPRHDEQDESHGGRRGSTVLMTRSGKLIKSSFASLQLICSDFLPSLPITCFMHLVDTLYKFCSQDDDLNVALTTVTFFWAISDFLSGKSTKMSITEDMIQGAREETLTQVASNPEHPSAIAALWVLLLLRLTAVAGDERLELRNSAIQTLLRIINAYGHGLDPETWTVCIKSVIFKLLASISGMLQSVRDAQATPASQQEWDETAVVVVKGVADLFANYLDFLSTHPAFPVIWQQLLASFTELLELQSLEINNSIFVSLGEVLAKCETDTKKSLTKTDVDLAWDIWSRGLPIPELKHEASSKDNQKCLGSWVDALQQLYRLIQADLDLDRVRRMLSLLNDATLRATTESYASDVEYVTSLQGKVLNILKLVRTDIPGVPSALIVQVAEFVALAFNREVWNASASTPATSKRTFVALSKESMPILHYHITRNASDTDIYASGSYARALSALSNPVVLKYQFPVVTKSIQPWREATKASLAILEATLPHLRDTEVERPVFQECWQIIAAIANGVIKADDFKVTSSTSILDDEEFDISAFSKLRELIIPVLGAESVPDKTRKTLVEGLFRTSIVHSLTPTESEVIHGNTTNSGDLITRGLSEVYKPRNGRTVDPTTTRREKMALVCLDELFSLLAAHDEAAETPSIVVQPPTPRFPRNMTHGRKASASTSSKDPSADDDSTHASLVRLARTAAPYLILRCALTLRAFVADQPLRGRMPQPRSQRRELVHVLRGLVELRSEPDAIPDLPGADSETRKHLLRLYPLLVRAVQVAGRAGDEKIVGLIGEALEAVGTEMGVQ